MSIKEKQGIEAAQVETVCAAAGRNIGAKLSEPLETQMMCYLATSCWHGTTWRGVEGVSGLMLSETYR